MSTVLDPDGDRLETAASSTDERRILRLASADFNLLVPLLMLLEERSVSRAASRFGLSQPAMSHLLKRARLQFGDQLLVRHGTTSSLTPRARRLVPQLRNLLDGVGDVFNFPSFDPLRDDRVISLLAMTTTALVVVPPLRRRLAREAPHIGLRLRTTYHPDEPFDSDDLDLLLLADAVATGHPRSRLYDDEWIAVVSSDNTAVGDVITPAQLASLPHVAFEYESFRIPPYATMDALGIHRRVGVFATDFLLIPHLVAGSDSLAIMQRRAAQLLGAAGGLKIALLPFETPTLGIDVVWNPRLGDAALRTWFDAQLRATVDDLP